MWTSVSPCRAAAPPVRRRARPRAAALRGGRGAHVVNVLRVVCVVRFRLADARAQNPALRTRRPALRTRSCARSLFREPPRRRAARSSIVCPPRGHLVVARVAREPQAPGRWSPTPLAPACRLHRPPVARRREQGGAGESTQTEVEGGRARAGHGWLERATTSGRGGCRNAAVARLAGDALDSA